jgi:hypothetical protein
MAGTNSQFGKRFKAIANKTSAEPEGSLDHNPIQLSDLALADEANQCARALNRSNSPLILRPSRDSG